MLLRSVVCASPVTYCAVLCCQSRCGNSRLESRVRENRTHGSEGGESASPFRPLSPEDGGELSRRMDSRLRGNDTSFETALCRWSPVTNSRHFFSSLHHFMVIL